MLQPALLAEERRGKRQALLRRDRARPDETRARGGAPDEDALKGSAIGLKAGTSEPAEQLSAEGTMRMYKSLAQVDRAFRCLKGIDLLVRPIRHRTDTRVLAHILPAYYVERHMRRALAPLLFEDDGYPAAARDVTRCCLPPPRPRRSKKATHTTSDGLPCTAFKGCLPNWRRGVATPIG